MEVERKWRTYEGVEERLSAEKVMEKIRKID